MGYKSFSDATADASEQTNFYFSLLLFSLLGNIPSVFPFNLSNGLSSSTSCCFVLFFCWRRSLLSISFFVGVTVQRELLAKRYGKFDLGKKKHQTTTLIDFSPLIQNIFLRWTCRETMFCGYSRSLNLTVENLAHINRMFHQNCTLVMEGKWSETEFIHSGAQMRKWHFLWKNNIIIFINFGECLPCECTLGRLALGFNCNITQSPVDWATTELCQWEWELLQEEFKRQQGHVHICISLTRFIFFCDSSTSTPTNWARTMVWERWRPRQTKRRDRKRWNEREQPFHQWGQLNTLLIVPMSWLSRTHTHTHTHTHTLYTLSPCCQVSFP